MRSTSLPKSAWPGVSTMLKWVFRHTKDAFLEKIVIPRSLSSGFESMIVALALAKRVGAGLLEQRVDQRGLAVVDVGDDGHVPDIFSSFLAGHEIPRIGAGDHREKTGGAVN